MARRNARGGGDRGRGPQPIADVLSTLMARRGYARVQGAEALQQAWRAAAGEFAGQTRPAKLQRGILEVLVANSVVLQELSFAKTKILTRLQEQAPEQRVRDLKFRVGPLA